MALTQTERKYDGGSVLYFLDEITATVSLPEFNCIGLSELIVSACADEQTGTATFAIRIEFNPIPLDATLPAGLARAYGGNTATSGWLVSPTLDADVQATYEAAAIGVDGALCYRVPILGPAARVTIVITGTGDWNAGVFIQGVK